ncbi:hypothetical protein pdam_00011627 [Pocillopora damicornis]|uniref:Uncharacterized protein n=1 Tax=Pocillopora damicornis TaxID=46731 RepID=A0A3M6TLB4_POCDA|nr:hypothetical protein pdam_00011627 [Pocillopora damicornis]
MECRGSLPSNKSKLYYGIPPELDLGVVIEEENEEEEDKEKPKVKDPCPPIFLRNLPSGEKILISLLPTSATTIFPSLSTDRPEG